MATRLDEKHERALEAAALADARPVASLIRLILVQWLEEKRPVPRPASRRKQSEDHA
jgi:hypothetical protein